jgi:hypothetical protein
LQSRRRPGSDSYRTAAWLLTFLTLAIASIASAATHHVPADVPTIEEAFEIA